MNRVYSVKVSYSRGQFRVQYHVVAKSAHKAISKALAAAKRDGLSAPRDIAEMVNLGPVV